MSALLDDAVESAVADILSRAAGQGRYRLFEHEVYAILDLMDIDTPRRVLVPAGGDVTMETLAAFPSERIVLKAAADDIAHKQQAGAVKIVYKDLEFVRFHVDRMTRRLTDNGHAVTGILLVEYIEYAKDLGNEVLLGFNESDAFGPVISFSKGGSDAEHFANHFSPPNLILPPIDRQWAQALLDSTHIQQKYLAEGHTDYTQKIVAAGMAFSRLAMCFSPSVGRDHPFAITEFEVNPFAFTPEGTFLALDGFAVFAEAAPSAPMADIRTDSLVPFFEPTGVAVVGVSGKDMNKPGNIIVENMVGMDRDDLYCVNPGGGSVTVRDRELPFYPSVSAIDGPVDLAVVTVPAKHTLAVVEDCAAKGVKAAILIPGGFSEMSKSDTLERRIREIADGAGMRLIGPNCLGIVYTGGEQLPGVHTFFIPEEKFRINMDRDQHVAILSQSGALGLTEIYNLRNAISPKAIVSYGNQLDVDVTDLIAYFDADRSIDVIGCYIEGFSPGGGRKFFNQMVQCQKPVVVYKAGRTEVGQRATESHTASIAGEYEVAKAAMKQAGLIVADTMMDHGDFIKTFALLNDFDVRGNRIAIVANAGYEKTYAADNLGGLTVAELDADTVDGLTKILPPFVNVDPLLDLTPMAGDETFEQSIDLLLKSDAVDTLFVSIVPHSTVIHTTDAEIERNPENVAARIVQLVHRYKKPTVVSVCVASGADAVYNKFGQVLDAGGVPAFLTASRAMACLNEFVRYRMTKAEGNVGEWLK